MHSRTRIALLVTTTLLAAAFLTLLAAALGPSDPLPLFTENIEASHPSENLTDLERALLNHIENASKSIDAAIYGFNRVSVREALVAAHNRGVSVRIVADDEAYADEAYQPHFSALTAAGIPIVQDNRSSLMHNKFFIIDGEVVWSGSTNLTDTGFTFNHNNTIVFTSTVLADIYGLEFSEMFDEGLFGTAKSDNVTHTLAYNGIPMEVYFSPSDEAMAAVLTAVATADESIRFGIFFFTDDELGEALAVKAQSGVDVSGVWDALGAANLYSEDERLCQAGATIKIEDLGGKLHHKFMIIDAGGSDPVVISGSMNWTAAGSDANDENTVLIHDEAVAQTYLAAYRELEDALADTTLCTTAGGDVLVFLPLITKALPATPTPPASATPTPSPTPMSTVTATPSPQGSGIVKIVSISYDGAGSQEPDEYVQIRNDDSVVVQLDGWTLRDAANHVFTFPDFLLQPGQQCRIYTNQIRPEWCGFSYGSGAAIWNNSGDTALLRNSGGTLIDSCSYSGGGSFAACE